MEQFRSKHKQTQSEWEAEMSKTTDEIFRRQHFHKEESDSSL